MFLAFPIVNLQTLRVECSISEAARKANVFISGHGDSLGVTPATGHGSIELSHWKMRESRCMTFPRKACRFPIRLRIRFRFLRAMVVRSRFRPLLLS